MNVDILGTIDAKADASEEIKSSEGFEFQVHSK